MTETILDRLLQHASATPNKVAYRFLMDGENESDVVTFAQLRDRVAAVSGLLLASGLSAKRVVVSYPFGIDFIYAFLGCLMAGAIPMPIALPRPNRPNDHLSHIIKFSAPEAGLTTASILSGTLSKIEPDTPLRQLPWIATDRPLPHTPVPPISNKGQHPALIQFSSGSTSMPKGIVIGHDNIMANQAMIQTAFGHHRDSQGIGWLPMYHDMGLIGNVLQCIYVGYTMTFLPPVIFIQKPIRWLQAISKYHGTSSGGPNFAYAHCVKRIAETECEGLDLRSWDLAFNGAEPIHAKTLDDFTRRFSPYGFKRSAIFPCYGLAEGTLIVSGAQKGNGPTLLSCDADSLKSQRLHPATDTTVHRTDLVGSGQSLMNGSLRIVDPEKKTRVPDGTIGEIWISGSNVALGYWENQTLNTGPFSLTLDGETPLYYATGDLGAILNRELYVTGRRKELMIIDGKNHYPQDLELTIHSAVPVLSNHSIAVFSVPKGTSESVIVVQEIRRPPGHNDLSEWTQQVRIALSMHHDLVLGDLVFVPIGTIEKTSSGKPKRLGCRQRYTEGQLPVFSPENAVVMAASHS